ncbi:MAG: hypothetical protein LBU82_07165 [Treponema sp.]|jgi:hypothetical protein|nr:hypothetical protein [Treponema sp.]
MSNFISKKLSLFLLFSSWFMAAAVVFLLNFFLDGPKLGPVYDMLLGFRPKPPVSSEIILIDTDEIMEPYGLYPVLITLSEMGASDLLVVVPVLGAGSGRVENVLELSERVSDEFRLLGKNIRNLFNAIRLGYVEPKEANAFIESLVELSERGRDRLNAAIIRQEETGSAQAAQAAAAFGRAVTALDLHAAAPPDIPWYSQTRPDGDRVFRRIAPVEGRMEHIVYHVLKRRWAASAVELTETGQALVIRQEKNEEGSVLSFPLDRYGNILVEKPGKDGGFRRIALNLFLEYDEADRSMARLLKESEELGVYAETAPEERPLILLGFAEDKKEELLKDPDEVKRAEWIKMRLEYIAGLEEFLYGPSEMKLVNGYEELLASGELGEKGIIRMQELRDKLIRAFVAMREKHRELVDLRSFLMQSVDSSFCIMGPAMTVDGGTTASESSAMLANALLTGNCVRPGQKMHMFFWPLLVSFVALACVFLLKPLTLLITGTCAAAAGGAAFGAAFVISGYWLDPVIPMAACFSGTLALFVSRSCIGYGRVSRFRRAYAPYVGKDTLNALIKSGRPLPSEILTAYAVIIAVKKTDLFNMENREEAAESGKAAARFRNDFLRTFKRAGAVILGFEGDIALACFGSPLEQKNDIIEINNCSLRAALMVKKILKDSSYKNSGSQLSDCRFGIEAGECVFSWSEAAGYKANGRAAIRARLYASLAKRCNVRAIIGESAMREAGLEERKLSSLDKAGPDEAVNYYELTMK